MATAILPVRKFVYGTGVPAYGDDLTNNLSLYPVGTVYINLSVGSVFLRTGSAKLPVDFIASGITLDTPTLAAPASLTATVNSATAITLNWPPALNATGFVLQRSTAADFSGAVEIYAGANGSYQNTGLTTATLYYFRVKSTAAGFTDSAWTSTSATTL